MLPMLLLVELFFLQCAVSCHQSALPCCFTVHTAVVKLVRVQTGCMHVLGVFHPLLLEPSLPPLKEPPATEVVNYDAAASPSSSAAADSMGKASWEPQQPPRQIYGQRGRPKGKVPCPVDLLVPAGVKVVAVTGPNTGIMLAAPLYHKSPAMFTLAPVLCLGTHKFCFCGSVIGKHYSGFCTHIGCAGSFKTEWDSSV